MRAARLSALLAMLLVSMLASGCFSTTPDGGISGLVLMESAALTPPKSAPAEQPHRMWGTLYYVHAASVSGSSEAVPLRGQKGQSLGVRLSVRDWCNAAREGTVAVETERGTRTFNHAGWGSRRQTNCAPIFPGVAAGDLARFERTVFMALPGDAPDGLGSDSRYRLVPYRTVAVDKSRYPLGTAFYIPGLKGRTISRDEVHDGYVFAADTGVGVHGNHLDFFIGHTTENPAPDIFTGSARSTFEARVVTDDAVVKRLRNMHLRR